jgi:rhodanese-related sulfurtransferase
VVQVLKAQGFKQVYALQGGFDAWQEAGYPMDRKSAAA